MSIESFLKGSIRFSRELAALPEVTRSPAEILRALNQLAEDRRRNGGEMVYDGAEERESWTAACSEDVASGVASWITGRDDYAPRWTGFPTGKWAGLEGGHDQYPDEIISAAYSVAEYIWRDERTVHGTPFAPGDKVRSPAFAGLRTFDEWDHGTASMINRGQGIVVDREGDRVLVRGLSSAKDRAWFELNDVQPA